MGYHRFHLDDLILTNCSLEGTIKRFSAIGVLYFTNSHSFTGQMIQIGWSTDWSTIARKGDQKNVTRQTLTCIVSPLSHVYSLKLMVHPILWRCYFNYWPLPWDCDYDWGTRFAVRSLIQMLCRSADTKAKYARSSSTAAKAIYCCAYAGQMDDQIWYIWLSVWWIQFTNWMKVGLINSYSVVD